MKFSGKVLFDSQIDKPKFRKNKNNPIIKKIIVKIKENKGILKS
mgnify:FL=1